MVQALPLFGSPLVTALARSSVRTSSGLCVPGILARCFSEIEKNGLKVEGIFRKSGSTAIINQLQKYFENVEDPFALTLPDNTNGHSMAGLLKRYLQQLPEPVIPKHYQKQFLSAFEDKDRCTKETTEQRLKEACKKLPYEHLHLLQFIIEIAVRIQRHQDKNQMSLNSLAIIFAPTCVRLDGVSQLMPNSALVASPLIQDSASSSCSLPLTINKHHDFIAKARKLIVNVLKRKMGRQHSKSNWLYNKNSMSLILYQPSDLLQLDLMKESNTWVGLFEFMMNHPESFTTITQLKGDLENNKKDSKKSLDRKRYGYNLKDSELSSQENKIIHGYGHPYDKNRFDLCRDDHESKKPTFLPSNDNTFQITATLL